MADEERDALDALEKEAKEYDKVRYTDLRSTIQQESTKH